jgi:hypothetical protein
LTMTTAAAGAQQLGRVFIIFQRDKYSSFIYQDRTKICTAFLFKNQAIDRSTQDQVPFHHVTRYHTTVDTKKGKIIKLDAYPFLLQPPRLTFIPYNIAVKSCTNDCDKQVEPNIPQLDTVSQSKL